MKLVATCPGCDEEFEVDDDLEVGEIVVCSSCERELEVVGTDPLTLTEWDEEEK